ncbi:organic cation transporter protein-like [Patiria miniata]|uniref:Major facilitator superfamily (MFS) profile domain-containing protein n=1 Tax=Patiria miniata TaxID=46514 RepID=A0A913YYB3_PATMI|nr:organic cation transporter protein-like [Patiria miniata]
MDVDSILEVVGLYSRVQVHNFVIFSLSVSLGIIQLTSVAITIDQSVEHYCKPSPGFTANQTTPFVDKNGRQVPDSCHMFDVRNGSLTENITNCQNGWVYPGADHGETNVLTDLDLVCDRSILASTLMSLHFAGTLVGAYVTGQAADIFGRRPVAVSCLALTSIIGAAISFTWNLELMMALRFLLGIVLPGNTIIGYNRCVEMFTPKTRLVGSMTNHYFATFGLVMVAPIAVLLPNWRHFQLAVSLGCLPLLPLHWFFSYEALRWLVQKGRLDEAEDILQKIAKSKNVKHEGRFLLHVSKDDVPLALRSPDEETPDNVSEQVNGNESAPFVSGQEGKTQNGPTTGLWREKVTSDVEDKGGKRTVLEKPDRRYNILDLFKTRALIKHTTIVYYMWFSVCIMYFGLLVYATSLTGNKYLNFFLLALVEAPVYCHDYFVVRRFGRRRPIAFFFLASAVLCILIGFLPEKTADGTDLTVLIVVVAMIGKFYVNAAYELTMLVGAEVFPTVLRNVGQGSAVTVGRVGSIVAPFIIYLKDVASFLPMTMFASLSLVACLSVLLLPETTNRPLPETYEDGSKLTGSTKGSL